MYSPLTVHRLPVDGIDVLNLSSQEHTPKRTQVRIGRDGVDTVQTQGAGARIRHTIHSLTCHGLKQNTIFF